MEFFLTTKKNRPKLDEGIIKSFVYQQKWLMKILPLLGVGSISVKGYEADDILYVWSWLFSIRDTSLVIFSGDKDMWQLVSDIIEVLSPQKGIINYENFSKKTSFKSPEAWLWYKILVGDPSDGIPGVGGIGDKKGRQLVGLGWPSIGDAPLPKSLQRVTFDIDKGIMNRNATLIDLRVAGHRLRGELSQKKKKANTLRPKKDLVAAQSAAGAMGMYTIVGGWRVWSYPFGRLVA